MNYSERTIEEFADLLAGKNPVPGGGGAAALAGAAGIAAGNMVASLTIGKKKYAEAETELISLKERGEEIRKKLLSYIDEDAKAFEPLSNCYKMPAETQEEKRKKEEAMEKCLLDACTVPLKIMECCCEAIEITAAYSKKGSRLAISDAGCAATLLKSSLEAAALNIYINTKEMKDREAAMAFNQKAESMLDTYGTLADDIYKEVKASLMK